MCSSGSVKARAIRVVVLVDSVLCSKVREALHRELAKLLVEVLCGNTKPPLDHFRSRESLCPQRQQGSNFVEGVLVDHELNELRRRVVRNEHLSAASCVRKRCVEVCDVRNLVCSHRVVK